jgi:hypothetical protein
MDFKLIVVIKPINNEVSNKRSAKLDNLILDDLEITSEFSISPPLRGDIIKIDEFDYNVFDISYVIEKGKHITKVYIKPALLGSLRGINSNKVYGPPIIGRKNFFK